jgi:Domain of unknown function (DUF4351)
VALALGSVNPSLSKAVIASFGAQSHVNGLLRTYALPAALQATIVVIHQLPKTSETLWLRLLGRGKVQSQAIVEVLSLPIDDPARTRTLQLLASWKNTLEVATIEGEERELMMALSQAYLESEQRTIEQGLQRERSLILKLLSRKLGNISPETRSQIETMSGLQLEALEDGLLDFSTIADLASWLQIHQG